MLERRIEWEGGMNGHLTIASDDPVSIQRCRELVEYLYENCISDNGIHFEPEEIEIMGAIALFMAIREQLPYKRGYVLCDAVLRLGGISILGGYDFISFSSPVYDLSCLEVSMSFSKGCRRLTNYLYPIQAESQYALRCVAFEYVEGLLE